ncbi:type I DNA topoisomerase [Selenihalanaerobacter shriftii]|uniref:DNA topoisomerase 1 n=1 Tax=Selenihalanaerobacter shriftii TaxID=142842 RepID=A0A1T4MA98_9FIRM|nr:type I DNA topoisomerase [Selenihalanaerobacter shriftii]SJZ63862.1 DNA topoisomerase I [Selenihalanaerobacter shriftii]
MAKNLVIVESPAKAKTISKFLGKSFKVEASMGHVIDLPKSQLGVNVEENFEPKYITIRGKGDVLKKLRKATKKSDNVFLATDPDREGEAISWHLSRALKLDDTSKCRIEFNEITKQAIKNAIKDPRQIDQNRVDAQQARRLLDRLVGYKLSPLLWKKVRRGLSAGRVQSVAVKIICEREEEIEAFEPEEYWTIDVNLESENQPFEAKLHRINNNKFKIKNEKEVNQAVSEIKQNQFNIKELKERKRRRNPSPPFTTSSLQQKAANSLNFSAKKTMYIAQQLYEGLDIGAEGTIGLITYIRTDSTRISKEAQKEARGYIKKNYGDKYCPKTPKKYKTKSGAQDAHEAIRPTSVLREPKKVKKYLNNDQYRLYKMLWERFVASQMNPAIYKTLSVDIQAGKYLFRAKGSQTLFKGFLAVDTFKSSKEDTELPELKEGEEVKLVKLNPDQHFTKPPARYTEAKLVKTLEEKGIGRPSTYAPIVGTIQNRGYVQKEGKRFEPTDLGKIVNQLLSEHFPDVTDTEFTANLEEELDSIVTGKVSWKKVLKDFYFPFAEKLDIAYDDMEKVQLEEEVTDEVCEECGKNMIVKHGRYGKFLACPGFPDCKNTKPYLIKTGVDCLECEEGEMVQRKSKKGRTFYGCSNYPDCEFMIWNKPTEHECPDCDAFLMEKTTKKRGTEYLCANKECDFKTTPEDLEND